MWMQSLFYKALERRSINPDFKTPVPGQNISNMFFQATFLWFMLGSWQLLTPVFALGTPDARVG